MRLKRLSVVLLMLGLVGNTNAGAGKNLLANSDFMGVPGQEDFGWVLDLRATHQECTVVQGRLPGRQAIRFYNDELGTAFISQTFAVRPWRWYVGEVWVNSEGMFALDFAPNVSLSGGLGVAGSGFHDDAFDWPKSGWRRIRVIARGGDADQLTFSFGGGMRTDGWSGELLFSEPVVRECSLVEAAGYYLRTTHPVMYGLEPDKEHSGRLYYGYNVHKESICRVIRGYPNPLYITGRTDTAAPEGRVSLVLPAGIRFRRMGNMSRKTTPKLSDLPDGSQHVELPPGGSSLVLDADLEPGELATGYVYYEWKGGYQVPAPIVFAGVEFPNVTAPKRTVTTLCVHGSSSSLWKDNDYEKKVEAGMNPSMDMDDMIRDIKRFGFNGVEGWGGDARQYSERGVRGITAWGGAFRLDPETYPEALAVKLDGKPSMDRGGLMCPSYRGIGVQSSSALKRVKASARFTSCLTLDDEFYTGSSESPIICFCDRCMERWKQWTAEYEPDLSDENPRQFARRPHKYPEHYHAWLRFRCDLQAERYGLLRQAFFEAVKVSGVKTTPQPMLGAYIGAGPLVALHSNKSLSAVLDYIANMVYEGGDGVRKTVAQLAPRSGGKLVVAISPGHLHSPPGDARSQVLEAMMGGSRGFIAWGYWIGMTAGHMVDIAEAIKMFAPVEDVILDGEIEDGYKCNRKSVNLLVRKKGEETVLLVSDYSPGGARVKIEIPDQASLEVVDLFTDEVVARLDAEQRFFEASLRRDFQARLYHLRPAGRL